MVEILRPSTVNDEIVRLLHNALAEAQAGKVVAIGIVTVNAMGNSQFTARGPMPNLYVGLDALKATMLSSFMTGRSGVVRAAG